MRPSKVEHLFNKIRKRLFKHDLDHISFRIDELPKPDKKNGVYKGITGGFSPELQTIRIIGWYARVASSQRMTATIVHELCHTKVDSRIDGYHGKEFALLILSCYRKLFTLKRIRVMVRHEFWKQPNGKMVRMDRALRYYKIPLDK